MNNTQKIVIAIIIAGLLIGGGIWLGTKKTKMVKIPLENKTEITTDVFKDSYMEGCMGEDTNYALCNCSYNSLLNQMGKEKLVEFSVDYLNTNEMPAPVLKKIMTDCL